MSGVQYTNEFANSLLSWLSGIIYCKCFRIRSPLLLPSHMKLPHPTAAKKQLRLIITKSSNSHRNLRSFAYGARMQRRKIEGSNSRDLSVSSFERTEDHRILRGLSRFATPESFPKRACTMKLERVRFLLCIGRTDLDIPIQM